MSFWSASASYWWHSNYMIQQIPSNPLEPKFDEWLASCPIFWEGLSLKTFSGMYLSQLSMLHSLLSMKWKLLRPFPPAQPLFTQRCWGLNQGILGWWVITATCWRCVSGLLPWHLWSVQTSVHSTVINSAQPQTGMQVVGSAFNNSVSYWLNLRCI